MYANWTFFRNFGTFARSARREATKAGFKVSSSHVVSDNPVAHKSFLDEMPDYDAERKRRIYKKLPQLIKSVATAISERKI
ncbi:MAG: hypothetical protein ABSF24_11795 [Candidatus Bathyarchaeia archaeon]|jgi:hypothetical protein